MAVDLARLSAITSTTTVRTSALERVRGFTAKLLIYLKNSQRRCCEIAETTGKTRHYVYRYLKNMQTYGLATKNSAFWKLTDLGDFMADYFIDWFKEKRREEKKSRKIEERKKKEETKIETTSPKQGPKPQRQIILSLWLSKSTLSDKEKEVVEMLTKHYEETGSKHLYFKTQYELAERLQISPDQTREVFMHLNQDHVAYCWSDPKFNAWKIGLYKAFVEVLLQQKGVSS